MSLTILNAKGIQRELTVESGQAHTHSLTKIFATGLLSLLF